MKVSFYYVMCRSVVTVNLAKYLCNGSTQDVAFLPWWEKLRRMSDSYEFLNLILSLSNLIKKNGIRICLKNIQTM